MNRRAAMSMLGLGGLSRRRPDQQYRPGPQGVSPGARSLITARIVRVFGPGGGVFVYSPTIGAGNLIASIAAAAGTDPFGNAYVQGYGSYSGNVQVQVNAGQVTLTNTGGDTQGAVLGGGVIGTLNLASALTSVSDSASIVDLVSRLTAGIGTPLARVTAGAFQVGTAGQELVVYPPAGSSADDAANIAAIANGMTAGGILLLTGGVYNWASAQTLTRAGVKILGAGWMQTGTTNGSVLLSPAAWPGGATPMLTLAGEGQTLEGVIVAGHSSAANLIAVTATNVKITDCATRNPAAGGVCIDVQAGGTSARITGGRPNGLAGGSLGTGSIGIQLADTDAVIRNVVLSNHAVGIMVLNANGTQIEGCHITAGTAGMNDIWVNGPASQVQISGNRFDNCGFAPLQITPSANTHNVSVTDNTFQCSGIGAFPLIGYDTSTAGSRGIQINDNRGYADGVTTPTWFLAAVTQAGAAAANPGNVSALGSQVNGNIAWVQNAGFYAQNPAQARGNQVTTNGTAYANVADI